MTLKKGTAGKISRYLNKQEYLDGKYTSFLNINKKDGLLTILYPLIPTSMQVVLKKDTPLLSSGAIDSFGFIGLISALEEAYLIKIPETIYKPEYFETPTIIEKTIELIKAGKTPEIDLAEEAKIRQARSESLARLKNKLIVSWGKEPFIINLINHNPIKSSKIYRMLFRLAGIQLGKNVMFLGKVSLKIRGKASNIIIGDNVILGKDVDLRNRENGKIILHDKVYLDHNVRLVAARDGKIEIGMGTEIGLFSNITSGGITEIGEFAMISGFVNINSSRHGTDKRGFVKEQPHTHGKIVIGDDVWIGVGANILVNTNIGEGAVVAGNSLVSGDVEPLTFVAGVPAKFVKYRSDEKID
jgi:acetyltransferase-like isoleucine patch superfamily enzyme/acyl carrier protein